jgi:hypothetical protein
VKNSLPLATSHSPLNNAVTLQLEYYEKMHVRGERKQPATHREPSDTLHTGFDGKGCTTANSFIVSIILRQINTRHMTWVINLFRITGFLDFVHLPEF